MIIFFQTGVIAKLLRGLPLKWRVLSCGWHFKRSGYIAISLITESYTSVSMITHARYRWLGMLYHEGIRASNITVTSSWARWRCKAPASRLFAQPFVQEQIKENIKAPRYWPFVRGIHRWPVNSPHKGPETRKKLPLDDVIMTSHESWDVLCCAMVSVSCRDLIISFVAFILTLKWHHKSVMSSHITGNSTVFFNSLFILSTKKTSKLHITGP